MAGTIAPPPDYLVEREQKTGTVTDQITVAFRKWLLTLTDALQVTPQRAGVVALQNQNASIGATLLTLTAIPAGLYRVTFYARVTTAAGVTSSIALNLGWTESGIALAWAFGALTTNTTSTVGSDSFLLRSDGSPSGITYSATYASNPAGAMRYRLDVVVENVG